MNNLQAYGSSDSETDTATKPPEKLIFRVERIVDDEEYISKVKPKAKNLKDFLPAAIAKEEESYESLLKKVKRKSDGAGITLEVASQEEEILEAQDFFTIPNDKDDKVLEDVPILPLKPEKHVKPFVFKPKQKMSVTDDITSLVGREARNQKIEFKTINIQDQMGDKAIQNDRDLTLDTPSEDDPFKNLKGTFVPSSSSSRVNGIMKLAYDAKNSYKVTKAKKDERKAVQKIVRAKYGF